EEAAVRAAELLYLIRADELNALGLAQLPAELPAFRVEDVAEEPRPAHDPGQLRFLAEAHSLGELVADEAAAHHQHALGRIGFLDDGVGVVKRLKADGLRHLVRARPGRRL